MSGEMVLDRKIAYVNLSDGSYEIKKIPMEWRKKFLGGRGINMHLLSRCYLSIPDPFSPDNPLIFGAGLLAGIPGFGSRMNITSRSPESGHLGDSNMGGELGAEMVKAGLSHLVITGKSKKPVYLFIENGKIDFCNARKLKGLDTIETQNLSQDPGPIHENQVGPGPGKEGDSFALPVFQCSGVSERAQQPTRDHRRQGAPAGIRSACRGKTAFYLFEMRG